MGARHVFVEMLLVLRVQEVESAVQTLEALEGVPDPVGSLCFFFSLYGLTTRN